jgi:trimethylamine--corrinoid protein Co-methyltransferase
MTEAEQVEQVADGRHVARHIDVVVILHAPDAQAVYESQMSLWGALFGGCHFILHAAGWLEGGLTASFEKFILDVEMLQMFAELFQPVLASPEEIGIEAVAEVGTRGPFLRGRPHHAALP